MKQGSRCKYYQSLCHVELGTDDRYKWCFTRNHAVCSHYTHLEATAKEIREFEKKKREGRRFPI